MSVIEGHLVESLTGFSAFVRVAEARSFVGAGRQMGVTASAVGKAVARLEAKLGVQLFHRSTRSITLTSEGTIFLERCRRILSEIEAAELEMSEAVGSPRGRLRLSLPPVNDLVFPLLGEFMQHFPHVELDLDFTDRQVDVVDEGFDAVIRTGKPSDSRLSGRKLGDYRIILVASPGYLKRCGNPQVWSDLSSHTCLHYRFPNTGKLERWPLKRVEADGELVLPKSMVCNNVEARVSLALQGIGIACLPDFAATEHLKRGKLKTVLSDEFEGQGTFYVLWPKSKHTAPKVRAFVDFVKDWDFAEAKMCVRRGNR